MNEICASGAIVISDMIKINSSISLLNLSYNNLGMNGVKKYFGKFKAQQVVKNIKFIFE